MPPLFGIHSLKTSVHHPLWPLLERSSKPISTQRLILLSSLFVWLLCGADLFFVPGLRICLLLWSCCALESTTQCRLSAIKVKLELESYERKSIVLTSVGLFIPFILYCLFILHLLEDLICYMTHPNCTSIGQALT